MISIEEGKVDAIRVSVGAADELASANAHATGMSDMELIMQLARAEEDRLGDLHDAADDTPTAAAGIGGNDSGSASKAANVEMRALEELEKELGLDELQLFLDAPKSTDGKGAGASGGSGAASAARPAAAAAPAPAADDDNLDELERYLESLSAPK